MHIPSPATLPSLSALRTVHVHERVSQRIVYTPDIYISESKKKRESTWAICSLNHDRLRSAIACTALSAQLRTHFIILVHWITSCASNEKNYPQSVYEYAASKPKMQVEKMYLCYKIQFNCRAFESFNQGLIFFERQHSIKVYIEEGSINFFFFKNFSRFFNNRRVNCPLHSAYKLLANGQTKGAAKLIDRGKKISMVFVSVFYCATFALLFMRTAFLKRN